MTKKMGKIELTLPPIAFLDGNDGKTDSLEGRNVLLHVRTASVVEILEPDKCSIKEGVPIFEFEFENCLGIIEEMIAVPHFVAADDEFDDMELVNKVLKDCAIYYIASCKNEDRNIAEEELSRYN